MSDLLITRRNLAIRTGALALTGLLPPLVKAEETLPVVYYAREATPEAFIEIFDRLRKDLGAENRKGKVGFKLHGDEVDKNRALWKALQEHVPGSKFIECNWASGYTSGRGTTEGNYEAIVSRGIAREDLDILDRDGDYRSVQTKEGKWLKAVDVPEALFAEYGLVAVTVNFNVPTFSGYSAAVKNVGIGRRSRKGGRARTGLSEGRGFSSAPCGSGRRDRAGSRRKTAFPQRDDESRRGALGGCIGEERNVRDSGVA